MNNNEQNYEYLRGVFDSKNNLPPKMDPSDYYVKGYMHGSGIFTSLPSETPTEKKIEKKTEQIILRKNKTLGLFWDPKTCLVFSEGRFVIGKMVKGELSKLTEEDIKTCKQYDFKYKVEEEKEEKKTNLFLSMKKPNKHLKTPEFMGNIVPPIAKIAFEHKLFRDGNKFYKFSRDEIKHFRKLFPAIPFCHGSETFLHPCKTLNNSVDGLVILYIETYGDPKNGGFGNERGRW